MNDIEISVGKVIGYSVLIILILIVLFGSFYIIPAGYRGVELTFGKASDVSIGEGLHFKMPIVQKIVKMDIKTQKYVADASASSKDLQIVSTNIAVNYNVVADTVPELYKTIGVGYEDRVIQPAVQEVVKATTARFTAEELITKRAEAREAIKVLLKERLDERGIRVEDISITNFDFSDSFNAAVEAKVTQEQQAQQAENKLKQVEFEAAQRIAQAQAEAEAIRIQAQAIQSQGGSEYVQLQAIAKWDGSVPQIVMSSGGTSAVPFINLGEFTN